MSMARRIKLGTGVECQVELERCTNGLALLDHLYTQAREKLEEWQAICAEWDAMALTSVAPPKGMTAREVNARVECWYQEHPDADKARAKLASIKADLDKIARWFRSAEQRSTNAAAAMKAHTGGGAHGGFNASSNFGGR